MWLLAERITEYISPIVQKRKLKLKDTKQLSPNHRDGTQGGIQTQAAGLQLVGSYITKTMKEEFIPGIPYIQECGSWFLKLKSCLCFMKCIDHKFEI